MNTREALEAAKSLYEWTREKYVKDCEALGHIPDQNLITVPDLGVIPDESKEILNKFQVTSAYRVSTAKQEIIDVLKANDAEPMHFKDIYNSVNSHPGRKYPENTIRTQLNVHSDKVGEEGKWDKKKPFISLGRGVFKLKEGE